jgi:hypothetical protein
MLRAAVERHTRITREVDLGPLARATADDSGDDPPVPSRAPISVDLALADIPQVVVAGSEWKSLPLDPRRAYLLSLIDGMLSIGDVLDICGLRRGEAIAMLAGLIQTGVVVVGRPHAAPPRGPLPMSVER